MLLLDSKRDSQSIREHLSPINDVNDLASCQIILIKMFTKITLESSYSNYLFSKILCIFCQGLACHNSQTLYINAINACIFM